MRGSDPDAAVYWMMRMLEAGEDPLFVARRMVIFAAEDVGLADPQALLVVAVAAQRRRRLRRPARRAHSARRGGRVPGDRAEIERVLRGACSRAVEDIASTAPCRSRSICATPRRR